jgi:hypothetical protein
MEIPSTNNNNDLKWMAQILHDQQLKLKCDGWPFLKMKKHLDEDVIVHPN